MELKHGTLLQGGKYRIVRTLGQGGFGITYLAEHTTLGANVCIKEFFLKEHCNREADGSVTSVISNNSDVDIKRYKQKFLEEARKVSQIKHPHIVSVSDLFEENNTAYYVMEYIDGVTLGEIVKRRGALSEAEAVKYITEAAAALKHIHDRNILHLDVKPANIMVRTDGDMVVLIDFGLAKHYDAETGYQTTTYLAAFSPGYAPFEQSLKGNGVKMFCPATDIYALGATLFTLVTGVRPPEAAIIPNEGLPELPATLSRATRNAITKAMEYGIKRRPQSIDEFMSLLSESTPIIEDTTPMPIAVETPDISPIIEDTIPTPIAVETADIDVTQPKYAPKEQGSATNNIVRLAVEHHFDDAVKESLIIGKSTSTKITTDIRVCGESIATIVSTSKRIGTIKIHASSHEFIKALTTFTKKGRYDIKPNREVVLDNNPRMITAIISDYIAEIGANVDDKDISTTTRVHTNRPLYTMLAIMACTFVFYLPMLGSDIYSVFGTAIFPFVGITASIFFRHSSIKESILNRITDAIFAVIIATIALRGISEVHAIESIDSYTSHYITESLQFGFVLISLFTIGVYTVIKSIILFITTKKAKAFLPIIVDVIAFMVFIMLAFAGAEVEIAVLIPPMYILWSIMYLMVKDVKIEKIN